jgi:hypothetical protein
MEKINYDNEYQKIKIGVMLDWGLEEDDMEDEDNEDEVNREVDKIFFEIFDVEYIDTLD